ncbi:MAG TPA: sigma-70 family RNA polymerase sigma factor [Candidatus Limnocylindria bacterium]|nr:sigma-70 family RNA polymerase sigma factor [Candidatus Limnocylindria bacterium]
MVQRELVELARNGDREAFSALAASVVDRLYATAMLILRDHSMADDATEETIVLAWRDLPSLRDPDRFDAWLRRLLVNACRDEGRRHRRRRPEMTLLPVHEPIIGDSSSALADRDALERGFRRLTAEHRTVLVLHHYLGLTLLEVATTTSAPLGTVKSRVHHATRALRAALEADSRSANMTRGGTA